MSVYRVRLGDEVVEVDGVAGLVDLVKQNRLGPEDPVFVPASGKWHYARSIRQLRDLFPQQAAKPVPAPRAQPAAEPEEPAGAQVLNLRRGRWTPDGKGVEVPVFAYDIDADPPAPLRLGLIVVAGLLVVALAWTWIFGYRRYVENVTASLPESSPVSVDSATPRPTPRAATPAKAGAPATKVAIAPAPAASHAAHPSPTPVPLPAFDAEAMRKKVAAAGLVPVSRPDQLGPAMRTDLTKLAVPVHDAALVAMKGARDAAVPFALRVDYAPAEKSDAATIAKQRYAIVAMAGRRIAELHLHVQSFHLRTISGNKVLSDVEIPVDLAARSWQGLASGDEVSARFAGK